MRKFVVFFGLAFALACGNEANVSFDEDSDGHDACEEGAVAGSCDCNDEVKSINPAAYEVCGDNVDNDCDGKADEAPCGSNNQCSGPHKVIVNGTCGCEAGYGFDNSGACVSTGGGTDLCPGANDHPSGGSCICDAGYQRLVPGAACTPIDSTDLCPGANDHPSGGSCICDAGYHRLTVGAACTLIDGNGSGKKLEIRVGTPLGQAKAAITFSYSYCPLIVDPAACRIWEEAAVMVGGVDDSATYDHITFSADAVQGGVFRFNTAYYTTDPTERDSEGAWIGASTWLCYDYEHPTLTADFTVTYNGRTYEYGDPGIGLVPIAWNNKRGCSVYVRFDQLR